MSELLKDDLQWNKMWDLWVEEKLESPYEELMNYYNEINNGGHLQFFDNVSDNHDLDEYVKNLLTILPNEMKENFDVAYKTYLINPEEISDENNEILDRCDSFYYENEKFVMDILKERASKINL